MPDAPTAAVVERPIIAPAAACAEALLIGKAEAAHLTGISVRSIDRLVSCGKFLQPVRLGGRVLWNRERLSEWVRNGCPRIEEDSR